MGFQSVYDDILICYSIPLRDATLSKRCPKTSCKAEQLAMKSQYRVPVLVPQSAVMALKSSSAVRHQLMQTDDREFSFTYKQTKSGF